jgi:type III restriction enzyme
VPSAWTGSRAGEGTPTATEVVAPATPGTGTIQNPIINSPFAEPARHFVMGADGNITGEIAERRRPSEFFVPIALPKKKSAQLTLDAFGQQKRQPNEIVNEIRQSVARWRAQDYPHITTISRDLLTHWRDGDRERRLFFCQIEAAETAIYLTDGQRPMANGAAW